MKRLLLLFALIAMAVGTMQAQYPLVTIRQIQEVSLDSLRVLDTLQRTQTNRWTLQTSPLYINSTTVHDTVRVRGVCVVPANIVRYTASGMNLLLADTASTSEWGGIFVRAPLSTGSPDTTLWIQWGMTAVEPGDYIEFTGYIDEFPSGDPVSYTQIVPLLSQPLTILGTAPIPDRVPKLASDFFVGQFPASPPYPPNGIQFSKGEPMELMRVTLTNLVVTSIVNATNGTFAMTDAFGNSISTMDASTWFTTRAPGTGGFIIRHPLSTYTIPPVGTVVDTIKGYILTNSGSEAPRGYRIAPIYPGDIVYGSVVLPQVTTHRRNPIIVPPDSTPVVSVRVTPGNGGLQSVQLRYSVNNSAFTNLAMMYSASDTTYKATIPSLAADSFVKYYIRVADSLGNIVKLASSATDGSQTDTLKGFFFYTVLNRPLTIRDIQYTPFTNGRSGYIGARVTVPGIITADSASLILPPTPFRGTNVWYLQDSDQPWSGIWIYSDSLSEARLAMRNGDSVAITGTVVERVMDSQTSYVTRLDNIADPVVYSIGNPLPSPVVVPTSTFFNVGKGTPNSERWEGMLVQLNNVTLTDTMPAFQIAEEFAVNDGSGQVIIRKDGRHHFTQLTTEVAQGKVLIPLGSQISYLRGVVMFSGNQYKVVPRGNDDFGTMSAVNVNTSIAAGWNMISNPVTNAVPDDSAKHLFPTITSRVFRFSGGYVVGDVMNNGVGYWGKFPAATTNTISGTARTLDSVTVVGGWNMVGSISNTVDTSTITSVPGGIRASNWFGFSGGYQPVTQIVPGKAYWVKANAAGKFVFASGGLARPGSSVAVSETDAMNSLTLTDSKGGSQTLYFTSDPKKEIPVAFYAMPPAPPAGAFDARFETVDGGSMLQTYDGEGAHEFSIKIQSDAYPLTVSWKMKTAEGEVVAGSTVQSARGEGSMKIASANVERITLRVTGVDGLPKEFALSQNYPNPFNPSTIIKYALPVDSRVTVEIYNIIGQRVRTLVADTQPAGYHVATWDGLNGSGHQLASGVYFLNMTAKGVNGQSFNQIRKLMMLK